MFLTSISFYVQVLFLLLLYYFVPKKMQWCILLAGSIVLCYSGLGTSFFILAGTTFLAYLYGILRNQGYAGGETALFFCIFLLLSPLFLLKYSGFLFPSKGLRFIVPIGISFYTLQLIGYCIDVYRGSVEPESHFFRFFLFASYFPQILQGPIPRYSTLSPQLFAAHSFQEEKFYHGLQLILWGFFQKYMIADKAAVVVNEICNQPAHYQGSYFWIAGILYSIQLYTDFAGCVCIVQGISSLFGISLDKNFSQPYFADSISDFWRRWHISLSSWLRDYVYIPLGGNRKGTLQKYANIFVTFAISGIWHGAGYKYLFWGLLHGFYQFMGFLLNPFRTLAVSILHLNTKSTLFQICRKVGTFLLVMFAWIIFRANRLREGLHMLKSMFTVWNPWVIFNDSLLHLGLDWKQWNILLLCIFILFLVDFLHEKNYCIRERISGFSLITRWAIYFLALSSIVIMGTYGSGYDAGAFIYGGF